MLSLAFHPSGNNTITRQFSGRRQQLFSEEKRYTKHEQTLVKDGVPAYIIINTCVDSKYKITKEIITDPFCDTLLQKISFEPTDPKAFYHLYVLLAPHLNNEGNNNCGYISAPKVSRYCLPKVVVFRSRLPVRHRGRNAPCG